MAFLSDAAAYPHTAAEVRHVQTHISHVFLAGEFVYKLKKAVTFPFLDFGTIDRREHFCREEVRLNRRLAAPVYLDVLPVTEREWTRLLTLYIGHTTAAASAVVAAFLGGLAIGAAVGGRIASTPRRCCDLAARLAAFHAAAPVVEGGGRERSSRRGTRTSTASGRWRAGACRPGLRPAADFGRTYVLHHDAAAARAWRGARPRRPRRPARRSRLRPRGRLPACPTRAVPPGS